MIVLGLLLVLLAAGAVVVAAMEPSATVSTVAITLLGYTVQPNHLEMFVAGAVAATLLFLGLMLINLGSRRSARRRKLIARGLDHKPADRLVAGGPEDSRA
ncbi:hypothetical protein OIE66_38980 [Nonomuraea sp. NBC_01738]|uniref:hypothetical protein n=1 Tax=Nonomuraea sp. NBC_01738 TaxID=2976003 RepID=UPI002E14E54B|nr:hypothetical protein OIE66_38980 [Nonomuraea sp. NBC_01738]